MRRVTGKQVPGSRSERWAVTAALWLGLVATGCKVAGVEGRIAGKENNDTPTVTDSETVSAGKLSPRPATPTGPVTFDQAESAYHEGKYSEAVDLFSGYVVTKPENAWGHYMLGLSAWKAGQTDRAEEAFNKSLELDSTHVKSWVNLGRVLVETGHADSALEKLDRAEQLDPKLGDVYRLRGRALSELGKKDEAIEAYTKAVVLDHQDGWALNNLGLLLLEKGSLTEAAGPLALAVEVRPKIAVFHNNLGMVLEKTGYFVAATEQYKMAVEADQTHEKAASNLTRLEGREDKAGLPTLDLPSLAKSFIDSIGGVKPESHDSTTQPSM